ncbi:MAG: tyrosine-protein phosphatase [Candidatus Sumerlaeaceae bacterium]
MMDKPETPRFNPEEESRYILRVDPHCHILPGVDDGSKSMEMSLNMARRAAGVGIKHMVATPHGCHPALKCDLSPDHLRRRVAELNHALAEAQIPLRTSPGTEILLNIGVPDLFEAGGLLTWADQNEYILIELGFHHMPTCTFEVLNYFIKRGLTPILAHPERYTWLPAAPDVVRQLADLGCWFQINVMSINGFWGGMQREMAWRLMSYVPRWMIGTDSHSDADKFWGIDEVRAALRKRGLWTGQGEPRPSEIAPLEESAFETTTTS